MLTSRLVLSLARTIGIFAACLITDIVASGAEEIDFVRDVRPILSENCFFCHGPDEQKREGGLRLDTPDGAYSVIEQGAGDDSELIRRIVSEDPDEVMPPSESNRTLSAKQIAVLRRWIDQGASWEQHWSYRPLEAPPIPAVESTSETPVRNPIDAFVRRQLAERGIAPSPEADRATLIRRLSLDLTGLPPTPDQVAAFENDSDPRAYERLVDRLLQSPAYGQRMAWDWLDASRYADTNGYQGDNERTMWPWRDWVVDAFNRNLPFDQFTVWQLAGDLLPEPTLEQRLATAFCRNHMINGEGGRIAEENRIEYVMDMTETMGTVWLGMTLNCCRCHDHKYDPISNRQYYQLFAFFNQTPVQGGGGNPQTPPLIDVPRDWLVEEQSPSASEASDLAKVMVMDDMPEPRQTFMLSRGLYNKPGEEVQAGLPAFLVPASENDDVSGATLNRLTLARWLVDPSNPLTARVTVNRFWQQVFGVGLVKTAEDFGAQGEIPVQMDLLNWLAWQFQQDGWDVKNLMRRIVTSHTYRQSSKIRDPEAYQSDPENRLLSRGARYRLPAWMLRDQALSASGLLSDQAGGPGVNTYQPPGIWEEASFGKKSYQQDSGEKLYRRSLYIFWRRIIAPTTFFDSASRQTCTVKVSRTNTPLHALQTLNDTTYVEAARVLAERLVQSRQSVLDAPSQADAKVGVGIDEVMLRVLARRATDRERDILERGLRRSRTEFAADPERALALLRVGDSPRDETLGAVEHAAWTSLCLAVLNLDETLNRE